MEARGGFGAPGAHRADVRPTPQAGCGRAWRGSPEINAGETGSIPAEGGRRRPQLQAPRGMPRSPGIELLPFSSFPLWFMAAGTVSNPLRGRRVAQKHSPPWAGTGGLPVGKELRAVEWVWERKEQQGQISRLPASLAPAGPQHPARSLTQPWSIPPLSVGFREENVDPSALPCAWLGVAGPRFPGPDCPHPIQRAEPAASDGPASVTRRPRSAFATTWAPKTTNMPITPTSCAPGPPRPAKGALCLPLRPPAAGPQASGGLAPKAFRQKTFP